MQEISALGSLVLVGGGVAARPRSTVSSIQHLLVEWQHDDQVGVVDLVPDDGVMCHRR